MKKMLVVFSILVFGLFACGKGDKKGIEIVGSDTLLEMVQAEAEEYVKKTGTPVNVTGGGSGVGISKLLDGTCDIANASRSMKDKELTLAKEKGMEIFEVKVAIDAIAVIINPENPVKDLTNTQLGAIFKGEITNWKEVGGPDLKISLYGRQSSSGTFSYFRKKVLEKKDYSQEMKRMTGNAQIAEGIKNDKAGIGYVGIGYVQGASGIKMIAVNGVMPDNQEKVLAGEYFISRFLYQYVASKPEGRVKDFLLFELSEKGQEIVKETGFYPVGTEGAKKLNPFLY
jgi:phosphate transport system substrate-binding protein